jgi:CRP/FNR family transcriptional regulator, anaerobic regulatory protein
MLALSQTELYRAPATEQQTSLLGADRSNAAARELCCGEVLFQAGDSRTQLYRVERGAICHYARWDDGRREIIEFAFPGDIIGLGHLETHITTAQAMVDTVVSIVPASELERSLDIDGELAARLAASADREFDHLRARAINSGKGKPVERLAAYLSVLSHMGADEGRDPFLVSDDVASGTVAEQLDMSIDGLSYALCELERLGIVRASGDGLRISDLNGLENLARVA